MGTGRRQEILPPQVPSIYPALLHIGCKLSLKIFPIVLDDNDHGIKFISMLSSAAFRNGLLRSWNVKCTSEWPLLWRARTTGPDRQARVYCRAFLVNDQSWRLLNVLYLDVPQPVAFRPDAGLLKVSICNYFFNVKTTSNHLFTCQRICSP